MNEKEAMKLLLERLNDNGVATASVKDGRLLAFSKKKLLELVAGLEADGKEECIIFIKDPAKVN